MASTDQPGDGAQPTEQPESFEAMLERLDEIVGLLEQGDMPLERSIELFEEGMRLSRAGMARLDDADRKVNLLLQEDGQEREEPFDLDGGGES